VGVLMLNHLTLAMLEELTKHMRVFDISYTQGDPHSCHLIHCLNFSRCAGEFRFLDCVWQSLRQPTFLEKYPSDVADAMRWATSISWRSENLFAEQA